MWVSVVSLPSWTEPAPANAVGTSPIPYYELDIQKTIVDEIERRLSVCNQTE
ncbi:hypothetical protein KKE26_09340 [bacterium]|nr:hypothetical protein [bacterium]MBU1754544.1 hypothetical protein [bacterium]